VALLAKASDSNGQGAIAELAIAELSVDVIAPTDNRAAGQIGAGMTLLSLIHI